jgi:hypothetical protein
VNCYKSGSYIKIPGARNYGFFAGVSGLSSDFANIISRAFRWRRMAFGEEDEFHNSSFIIGG